MAPTLLLLGALLLSADPSNGSPEDIDRQLKKNEGKDVPAVKKAESALHQSSDQIRAAEALKKHIPKTCEQKCDFIEKQGMAENAANATDGKPRMAAGRKGADKNMKDLAKVCRDSCFAKGKIDKDYIKEHMPSQNSPFPAGGHKPGGGGGGSFGGSDSSSSSADSQ